MMLQTVALSLSIMAVSALPPTTSGAGSTDRSATPTEPGPVFVIYRGGAATTHGLAVLDHRTLLVSDSFGEGPQGRAIKRVILPAEPAHPAGKTDESGENGELNEADENSETGVKPPPPPIITAETEPFSSGAYKQPCGIAIGPKGRIHLCDTLAARIYLLDGETGRLLDAIDTAGPPWNATVLADGTIWYLTADGRLHRREPGGRTMLLMGPDCRPVEIKTAFDFAIMPGGETACVTRQQPGEVLAVDLKKGTTRVVATGFENPEGIAIGRHDQRLYIADTGANEVIRVALDGSGREVLLDGDTLGFRTPIAVRIGERSGPVEPGKSVNEAEREKPIGAGEPNGACEPAPTTGVERLFVTACDLEGQPLILTMWLGAEPPPDDPDK